MQPYLKIGGSYVISFPWQQRCYMAHSLKVRKYSGLLTPASLGSTLFAMLSMATNFIDYLVDYPP